MWNKSPFSIFAVMMNHQSHKTIIVLLLFLSIQGLRGQERSPYALDLKKELLISIPGMLTAGASYYIRSQSSELHETSIATLDPNDINSFDRSAVDQYSTSAEFRSDIAAAVSVVPLTAIGFMQLRQKNIEYRNKELLILAVMAAEVNLWSRGLTYLTKNATHRIRPFVYNPDIPIADKISIDAQQSFFSAHTSFAASNAFFGARVFSDYFPESRLKPLFWTAAALIPAYAGFQRYRAGQHFPSDIIVGYAYGAAVGILIPALHKKEKSHMATYNLSLLPYSYDGAYGIRVSIQI